MSAWLTGEIGLPVTENNLVLPCGIYGKVSKDFKEMGLIAYKLEWNDILTNKKKVVELPPNKDLNYFKIF